MAKGCFFLLIKRLNVQIYVRKQRGRGGGELVPKFKGGDTTKYKESEGLNDVLIFRSFAVQFIMPLGQFCSWFLF